MPKQLALSASHLASCIMWPKKFSFLRIILCTMSTPVLLCYLYSLFFMPVL